MKTSIPPPRPFSVHTRARSCSPSSEGQMSIRPATMNRPKSTVRAPPSHFLESRAKQPAYSIGYHAESTGQRVSMTKRRVRWRFGFANAEALERGAQGVACRGEEHEVILIWSVSSGKHQVMMNGVEIVSRQSKSGFLEFSWHVRNHHVKIEAYATSPKNAPSFRQYDLKIDRESYFDMPNVKTLGLYFLHGQMHGSPVFGVGHPDTQAIREQEILRSTQMTISQTRGSIQRKEKRFHDAGHNRAY
mmetsp:Transcript_37683/g.53140  ORF Transcript_37683/g.53140 Transcript_37683/m.53140 type:complete len:246 (+) Transcript_37683:73-810(+)